MLKIYIIGFILCSSIFGIVKLAKPEKVESFESTTTFSSSDDVLSVKEKTLNEISICLKKEFLSWQNLTSVQWMKLQKTIEKCNEQIANSIPLIETTPNFAEHKYYMIPKANHINDSCSVVTFGIGGDIYAEQNIKISLPKCTFLGFDPNQSYEEVFANQLGGKFVQSAVGGKNEKTTILKFRDGTYHPQPETEIRSAAELIETYHGSDKIVDILNIDVEGSEYSIFERLNKDKIFQNVCQINAEIHPVWYNENSGYSYHDAIKVFENIAADGRFLWIKAETHHSQFYCAYFVNIKNRICAEKYLLGRLL